jgi:hypothetical protein
MLIVLKGSHQGREQQLLILQLKVSIVFHGNLPLSCHSDPDLSEEESGTYGF